jgi:hypothetical protein
LQAFEKYVEKVDLAAALTNLFAAVRPGGVLIVSV